MNRHSGSYKGDGAKKEKQGALQAFAGAKRCSEARAKEITDHIANFVALDMRPVCVLDGQGFLKMLAYLEPGYEVPSQKHITSITEWKHELGKKKL